ncbi:MAG: hypothetical protein RRB13_14190 [bacterium]|nr:hypothetical protein [bacterium]
MNDSKVLLDIPLDISGTKAQVLRWGTLILGIQALPTGLYLWPRWGSEVHQGSVSPVACALEGLCERHLLPTDTQALSAEAIMGPQSLLLRFLPPIQLGADTQSQMPLVIPLWVRLRAGNRVLSQWPGYRLSRAWIGPDHTRGEMGFALTEPLPPGSPLCAAGEFSVANHSKETLLLESLAYPLARLGLYQRTGQWVSPKLNWIFEAHRHEPKVTIEAPANAELLQKPQQIEGPYWSLLPSILK